MARGHHSLASGPKRVRSVRCLHGCVVVMGMGFTKSSGEGRRAPGRAQCSLHGVGYVCACRCGPMQVRQCEATVDFTGRDWGHVTSPSHRTASNRTVPYHTHTQPIKPSSSVSVCRRQSLLIDARRSWQTGPSPKRVAVAPWIYGWDGMGESAVERRGRSVPHLVIPSYQTAGPEPEQSLAAGCRHACAAVGCTYMQNRNETLSKLNLAPRW